MVSFRLRDYTPRRLYARLAALVAVPVIAIFALTTWYYYEEHIAQVNEKLSQSIAREVGLIIKTCQNPAVDMPPQSALEQQLGLILDCDSPAGMRWPEGSKTRFSYGDILQQQLSSFVQDPVRVRITEGGDVLDFRSPQGDQTVRILIDRKRALAANTHFTIVWVLLGTLFLLALAFAFLRNQVRSILRLTEAAKAFGRGRDLDGFRPSGATEVRDAARAVIEMKDRLRGFAQQRTTMLAGVSHDLRTPLTRLKLQLAMLEQSDEIDGARADVDDMSKMLDEYLAFASGEEGEKPESIRLDHLMDQIIDRADGATLTEKPTITITARPIALKRTLTNLVSNAVGYGSKAEAKLIKGPKFAEIIVDDDGPGIPKAVREDAFKPFHRLEEARNQNVPGTGLGLTLARDFARAHGGNIRLEDSPLGGLRVRLRLPY